MLESLAALPSRVLLLLAVILAAGASTVQAARPAAVAPSLVFPICGGSIGSPVGADTLRVQYGSSVMQPLPSGVHLASIRPGLLPSDGTQAHAVLVEWDPVALAPDPLEVALRTRTYSASDLQFALAKWDLVPPLVQRSVDHVADPPRLTTAWVWKNDWPYPGWGHRLMYDAAGSIDFPPARLGGNPSTPVPGDYPVLAQSVCTGDSTLQSLRVLQAVGHAGAVFDTSFDALVQRFRVPAYSRLRWVEYVLGGSEGGAPHLPGTIALYDAHGRSSPDLSGAPMVQADFSTNVSAPSGVWTSHNDFDAAVTLEPAHDYWLLVRTAKEVSVRARALTGTEGPDFDAGIGELWARRSANGQWVQQPSKALAFRLIGETMGTVTAPPVRVAPLALRVSPNPVRGDARVECSGATGSVHFEMVDVRGRRVSEARLDAASASRWTWRAADADGAPLPAGVYFVRAVDGAGREGVQRVVLVH